MRTLGRYGLAAGLVTAGLGLTGCLAHVRIHGGVDETPTPKVAKADEYKSAPGLAKGKSKLDYVTELRDYLKGVQALWAADQKDNDDKNTALLAKLGSLNIDFETLGKLSPEERAKALPGYLEKQGKYLAERQALSQEEKAEHRRLEDGLDQFRSRVLTLRAQQFASTVEGAVPEEVKPRKDAEVTDAELTELNTKLVAVENGYKAAGSP